MSEGASEASGDAAARDRRPRPLYGEYATPEEQRARIAAPHATDTLSAGHALDSGGHAASVPPPHASSANVSRGHVPPGQRARVSEATAAQPVVRRRLIDRAVTFALLGYGLFSVVSMSSQLFSFEEFADAYLSIVGIDGTFTNLAQGRLWGTVAALVLIFGWVATATLSGLSLRRGRITFWIPIVGAGVFVVITAILICIPIAGDPAFTAWMSSFGSSPR